MRSAAPATRFQCALRSVRACCLRARAEALPSLAAAQGVTSLEVELRGWGAPPPTLDDVAAQVATAFAAHFGYPPPALPLRG